jgi:hypothetical protein
MELPRELVELLGVEVAEFERTRMMPYVRSTERIALEKGRTEGKAKGEIERVAKGKIEGMAAAKVESLLRLLPKRFGAAVPADLECRIQSTNDLAKLDAWFDTSLDATDLAEFRRACGI